MRRMTLALIVLMGAVAGAATALGQNFETLAAPEQQAMSDTFQYSLENSKTNQAAEWVNPDTGRSGAVVPVKTFENAQGQPCREFITTIIIGGKEEQGYGTACRQPDGSWQIVARERQTAAPPPLPPPPTNVYVYNVPEQYYYYPPGFYSPYTIYLSFSYVYRSGHFHRGTYYLDGRTFRHHHPLHIRERVFVGPRIHDHHRWYFERDHRGRQGYHKKRWADPDHGRDDGRRHRR